MRRIALVIGFMAGLIAPALGQMGDIAAVNAKWMEFFNKGDFAGIASLYTDDAKVFPPGSAMVRGRAAIETMWKGMAEQVSNPELRTADVKSLGPSASVEIGTFTMKVHPAGSHREVCGRVGKGRERLEARHRHLERWQVVAPSAGGMSTPVVRYCRHICAIIEA